MLQMRADRPPGPPPALDAPRRRTDLQGRNLDGETVLLDRDNGVIHQLNATAAFVWDHCDGHRSADEIADLLTAAFDVEAPTARRDVGAALEAFRALSLLSADGETGAR